MIVAFIKLRTIVMQPKALLLAFTAVAAFAVPQPGLGKVIVEGFDQNTGTRPLDTGVSSEEVYRFTSSGLTWGACCKAGDQGVRPATPGMHYDWESIREHSIRNQLKIEHDQ